MNYLSAIAGEGCRLFIGLDENLGISESSAFAVHILSLETSRAYRNAMTEVVIASKKRDRRDWVLRPECDTPAWACWFDGLEPLARFGESGDLLVHEPIASQVFCLQFETFAAGPFDVSDISETWESFEAFLRWLDEDVEHRLPSTWRDRDELGRECCPIWLGVDDRGTADN